MEFFLNVFFPLFHFSGAEFNSQNNSNELSSEDAAKQEATLKAILDAILPWLPQFTELLVNPPLLAPMNTTAGLLDPPLGQTRLSKKIFPWFDLV